MKIEAYLFGFYAAFFLPVTVIYWWFSEDWTGTTCLALTLVLAGMIAYYLGFTARRMEPRPEDRPEADISEGAGEVAFFAPYSWWPIALAGAFTLTVVGLAIGPFLAIIGAGFLIVAAFGLLFEYYVGVNRSQSATLGQLQAMGQKPTSAHKFLGE